MTRRIDLDQRRAEANAEAVELVVGGRTFLLPAILPVALSLQVDRLAQGGTAQLTPELSEQVFRAIVVGLVGDDADALMGAVSLDELQHVITTAYAASLGESSASGPSSGNGGTPPRPTVPASTPGT